MGDIIKIMAVEDEADIRTIIEFALDDENMEVMTCESGKKALSKVIEFKPDLILLDVMMPEMDGPETLSELRKLSGFHNTPVAFLTAKVQPSEIDHFKALGAVDVIAKPFDPLTLADQIREILGYSRD